MRERNGEDVGEPAGTDSPPRRTAAAAAPAETRQPSPRLCEAEARRQEAQERDSSHEPSHGSERPPISTGSESSSS
eukprot:4338006-Prymnesium_polylepis.1